MIRFNSHLVVQIVAQIIAIQIGAAFLANTATGKEADTSYLIIKASVSNSDKQPYWICLSRIRNCIHLSASQGLVKLKAGKYELHHIDFTKAMASDDTDRDIITNKKARSGGGTQFFQKSLELNILPELIYFVGDLQLTQKKSRKYAIDLNQDTSLIINACQKFPKVFEMYPVTDMQNKKTMKVSCRQ